MPKKTKPSSILLDHVEHLHRLRIHLDGVRKGHFVMEGQEPRTLENIEHARAKLLAYIERITDPDALSILL